jgi:ankyrin repeat protein
MNTLCRGQTPLHVAAIKGNTEIFGLLLSHGADIYRVDDLRQNVVHLTAAGGHTDCLGMILDLEDSLIEESDGTGNTPLHHAGIYIYIYI